MGLDENQCEVFVDSTLLEETIHGETVESSIGSVSAPSPAGTPSNEYKPFSGYTPQSKYEPYNSDNGWDGGTPFEAYNPEESSLSTNNKFDESPLLMQNGTSKEDQGWLGRVEQWRRPRSNGNYVGVRLAMTALF